MRRTAKGFKNNRSQAVRLPKRFQFSTADLKARGAMIGANDLFTAAHAHRIGMTPVTNNTREFGRVTGLKVENWTKTKN